MSEIVVYNDGEIELGVSVEQESVWLNRHQLSELFARDIKTIGKHINNVFGEKELDRSSTVAKFATVQIEGGREVARDIEYYNLDVIISVGYRVKSQKGVRFRQWATSVLKSYIYNGYAINGEKITHERFVSLENSVDLLKNKMEHIESKIKTDTLDLKQGIFYDAQIYDAYDFINTLLRSAKSEVVLIDNYIDESVFTLFSKYPDLSFTIHTNNITKQLKLDYEKYKKQYSNIDLQTFKSSHDRFLIIDKQEIYHIGASLKDLGKRWFAFSKIDLDAGEMLGRL